MAIGKQITAKVRFRVQQQELKQANATLDGMRARLLGANNAATGLTGRLYRMASAFAAFSLGTRAVGGLLTSITTGERMMAQLNVLEGGLDKAGVKWKEMLRFARETPFQIEENMTAYIALKGRGLDPSYEAMTAYGNVSAALGVRINDMTDAIAGSVVGLQQRLRNLGVGVKTNANTIEFTVQGVTTTVARNSAAIQAFWKNAGNTVFAKAMELQMSTLGGRLSNLKDVLFEVALAVGEGTTGNGLSASLQGVIAWLDAAGQSGYGAARAFGDKLAVAVRKLGELLKWLVGHAEQVERAIRLMFAAMAARSVVSGIMGAIGAMRAFAAASLAAQASVLLIPVAIVALAAVLEDLWVFMRGGKSLMGHMLGDETGGKVRNGLSALQEPLQKLADTARSLAAALGKALLEGLVALGPALVNGLTAGLRVLERVLDMVHSLISLIPSSDMAVETKDALIRSAGLRAGKSQADIEKEVQASHDAAWEEERSSVPYLFANYMNDAFSNISGKTLGLDGSLREAVFGLNGGGPTRTQADAQAAASLQSLSAPAGSLALDFKVHSSQRKRREGEGRRKFESLFGLPTEPPIRTRVVPEGANWSMASRGARDSFASLPDSISDMVSRNQNVLSSIVNYGRDRTEGIAKGDIIIGEMTIHAPIEARGVTMEQVTAEAEKSWSGAIIGAFENLATSREGKLF